jgi:hypothetical protein
MIFGIFIFLLAIGIPLTIGFAASDPDPENRASDERVIVPKAKAGSLDLAEEWERRDEGQILSELRGELGELAEELVYRTTIQGRDVTNLSYSGIKEAIRRRGNVQILDAHTEETENEIRALVKVRDLDNRIDVLGASSAKKSDAFAYVLAVNKAERNAFAKLIPARWYATLIEDWLQKHHQPVQTPAASKTMEQGQEAEGTLCATLKDMFPKDLQDKLNFEESGDLITVKPIHFLPAPLFDRIFSVVRSLGGLYRSETRDFTIPKPEA